MHKETEKENNSLDIYPIFGCKAGDRRSISTLKDKVLKRHGLIFYKHHAKLRRNVLFRNMKWIAKHYHDRSFFGNELTAKAQKVRALANNICEAYETAMIGNRDMTHWVAEASKLVDLNHPAHGVNRSYNSFDIDPGEVEARHIRIVRQ